MKTIILIAIAGCLDQQPMTDTDVAALNGETWATVDDNSVAETSTASIAINPITHKVMATGTRGSVGTIRGESATATAFGLSSTFTVDPSGHGTVGRKIIVDHSGNWYVWFVGYDAAYRRHDVVRWSNDDGATWTTRFDRYALAHEENILPNIGDIAVDSAGDVYVTNLVSSTIERSIDHGVTFATAGRTPVAGYYVCEAPYAGQSAVWGIGPGTVSVVSLDHGVTWLRGHVAAFGPCSQAANQTLAVGGATYDTTTGAVIHQVGIADAVPVFDGHSGQAYFVADLGDGDNQMWWVQREDGLVMDFLFAETGAASAAYDSERGLYVVGAARESDSAVHGLIRKRTAPPQ